MAYETMNFKSGLAIVGAIAFLNGCAVAQDLPRLDEVAKKVPVSELEKSHPLASFASSTAAYISVKGGPAAVSFDDPSLAGLDPNTARFVLLDEKRGWQLVDSKIDFDRRRVSAQFVMGRSYALVGASRFREVRAQQNRLCLAVGPTEQAALIDPICTRILCPAEAMAALDQTLGTLGGQSLAAMPGAASAGNICERCLQRPDELSRGLLECGITEGTPWGTPLSDDILELAFHPWWVTWPIWDKSRQVNFCSPGTYKVGRTAYAFPGALSLPAPFGASDVSAEVRYPAVAYGDDTSVVAGQFPLVVFLHGNHCVCESGCVQSCTAANRIPNHRGYDYLLDILASRGYIGVSIDAYSVTAINASFPMSDYEARGQLVLEHLRRWRDWNQNGGGPVSGAFQSAVDMTKIGLVGHSRGGEGVVAADVLNIVQGEGFQIGAVLAIAPTDLQPLIDWNPASPYLVILPNNDGDVWSLHGQRTYDRAFISTVAEADREEKTMFWIFGANHNFFNTTWTPGSGDPFASDDGIGQGRMSAPAQRRAGCQIITAFMEKELKDDDRAADAIRGELPMTGIGGLELHVAHQRTPSLIVDDFDHGNGKNVNSLGGAVAVQGSLPLFDIVSFRSGGFNASFRGDTDGLVLGSTGSASYESALPSANKDVRRYRSISLRVARIRESAAVPPMEQPADFSLTLIDINGNEANARFEVTQVGTVPFPAAGGASPTILTTLRLPLVDFKRDNFKFNFANVAKIRLELSGQIKLAVDDLMFDDRGPPGFGPIWMGELVILGASP